MTIYSPALLRQSQLTGRFFLGKHLTERDFLESKTVGIRLDRASQRELNQICIDSGKTITEIIRLLINEKWRDSKKAINGRS